MQVVISPASMTQYSVPGLPNSMCNSIDSLGEFNRLVQKVGPAVHATCELGHAVRAVRLATLCSYKGRIVFRVQALCSVLWGVGFVLQA